MSEEYIRARDCIASKYPQFSELDDELSDLSKNPPPRFTLSLLTKIMQWKLWRGKFRPRLLNLVQTNRNVEQWSNLIFQAPSRVTWSWLHETLSTLAKELKGVGPATASAILSVFHEDVPFMSDELLEAAKVKKPWRYTLSEYSQVFSYLETLEKQTGTSKRELEREIWTNAVSGYKKHDNSSQITKKRKNVEKQLSIHPKNSTNKRAKAN